jgi:hypothetical protein
MERRDFLGKAAAGATIAGIGAVRPVEAQVRNLAAERNSLKVSDFGAVGNGSADDTVAIQKAIDEANRIGGATVHLEGSAGRNFRCAGKLDLDHKRGVRLSGTGGPNANENTQLSFTGRTGPFISLRSSYSVTLENLRIASAGAVTGPLVATGHAGGKGDTMYLLVDHCMFIAQGRGPDDLLDLSLSIVSTVRASQFLGGNAGINGGKTSYSNAIQITETIFARQNEVCIRNAGEAWLISGCTFEPLANGRGAGLRQEGKTAWGLTFIGCWMGDVHGGTWIDTTGGAALGLSLVGNRIATTETAIKLGRLTQGVMISGNRIEGAVGIDFAGQYTYGASIVGNDLQAPVPIKNLGNALPHFVAGQYTTPNAMSGTTHFGIGTFSGDGGTRGSIQLKEQPQPVKPEEGDIWTNSGEVFIHLKGRTRRFVLG